MGKTVESYRIALEKEIGRWNKFTSALRKEDKMIFENMMDVCRNYASAGSNATRPVIFESMIMSVLLHQQKTLTKIEKRKDACTKTQQIQP